MCACRDDDPYLCWAKRYDLDIEARITIMSAVINDGGPCQCSCHDEDEAEWLDDLNSWFWLE